MNISVETVKRLPIYLRILKNKKNEGITNISSTTIANELKLKPIQVRKDLASVSKEEGKPGVGFEVTKLIEDINDFLDLNILMLKYSDFLTYLPYGRFDNLLHFDIQKNIYQKTPV